MVVVPVEKKNIDRLPIERSGACEPTKSAAHDDDTVAVPFGYLPSHSTHNTEHPGVRVHDQKLFESRKHAVGADELPSTPYFDDGAGRAVLKGIRRLLALVGMLITPTRPRVTEARLSIGSGPLTTVRGLVD